MSKTVQQLISEALGHLSGASLEDAPESYTEAVQGFAAHLGEVQLDDVSVEEMESLLKVAEAIGRDDVVEGFECLTDYIMDHVEEAADELDDWLNDLYHSVTDLKNEILDELLKPSSSSSMAP